MNEQNKKLIQEAVKEAAKELEGKLPELEFLSKRNPHAHLWRTIKQHMGKSYKECSDEQCQEILDIIAHYRANPC